jgi:hypothetical protein
MFYYNKYFVGTFSLYFFICIIIIYLKNYIFKMIDNPNAWWHEENERSISSYLI